MAVKKKERSGVGKTGKRGRWKITVLPAVVCESPSAYYTTLAPVCIVALAKLYMLLHASRTRLLRCASRTLHTLPSSSRGPKCFPPLLAVIDWIGLGRGRCVSLACFISINGKSVALLSIIGARASLNHLITKQVYYFFICAGRLLLLSKRSVFSFFPLTALNRLVY